MRKVNKFENLLIQSKNFQTYIKKFERFGKINTENFYYLGIRKIRLT